MPSGSKSFKPSRASSPRSSPIFYDRPVEERMDELKLSELGENENFGESTFTNEEEDKNEGSNNLFYEFVINYELFSDKFDDASPKSKSDTLDRLLCESSEGFQTLEQIQASPATVRQMTPVNERSVSASSSSQNRQNTEDYTYRRESKIIQVMYDYAA